MNKTIISGRLTADPELRQTKGEEPLSVTSFAVAVQRKFSKDDKADFIDVVAWRGTAEFVCKYFVKGKRIEVCGELQTRMRESKSGDKIKVTELIADEVFLGGDKADGEKAEPSKKASASKPQATADFEPNFDEEFDVSDPNSWPDFNK